MTMYIISFGSTEMAPLPLSQVLVFLKALLPVDFAIGIREA